MYSALSQAALTPSSQGKCHNLITGMISYCLKNHVEQHHERGGKGEIPSVMYSAGFSDTIPFFHY